MCGIWAIFGASQEITCHLQSCQKIAHRGPDSFRMENVKHFKNCGFGFHHLCIMDELYGMQPMKIHQHPHLWLVYNGEIYNYELLGKTFNFTYETGSDGESILQLYAEYGIETAVKNLDGVYAFCLLDTLNRKVFLGRDTVGVKPLFTLRDLNGFMAVSSEAKGLMDLLDSESKMSIEHFPPGHYAEYDLTAEGMIKFVKQESYHRVGDYPKYVSAVVESDQEDMYTNLRELLSAAVRKRLMSNRQVGCLLSGGLDSSLISALAVKEAKETGFKYPIMTFALGMEDSPDVIAARKVAKYIGSDHHEIIISPEEGLAVLDEIVYYLETFDIISIRGAVGLYLVCKYISEKTDCVVIMSGEGADEVEQGYMYFHMAPDAKQADKESRRLLRDLHLFDVLRGDRSTSAHGLEVRVPYLDHRFLAYFLTLPPEERQPREGNEKYLLRKAFSETGLLPDEILWRPKEGFNDGISPHKKSLFEYIQEYMEEKVSDDELSNAAELYPHLTPKTKEAYYYRRTFERYFPGQSHWIPYFWMPKWCDATDPSARTLKCYKK